MPSFADLIEVAYKKERVSGRRMARQLGILEEHGLKKVMEKIAGAQSLHILIDQRRREAADAAAKIATRKQAKVNARMVAAAVPDPDAWLAWFDGASHPNPGKMGIGGLLKNPRGELVASISLSAGRAIAVKRSIWRCWPFCRPPSMPARTNSSSMVTAAWFSTMCRARPAVRLYSAVIAHARDS